MFMFVKWCVPVCARWNKSKNEYAMDALNPYLIIEVIIKYVL